MSIYSQALNRRNVLFFMAATSAAGLSHSFVTSIADAINKAGRQRMLTQRMAKSYMALGQGVALIEAERVMSASMALFDRQLVELKAYAPTPDIKTTYQQVETKWSEYKTAIVGSKPDPKDAVNVLSLGNELLALSNLGTVQLENTAARPLTKLVNTAGRQRMLSQRIASYYLAASWNVGAAASKAEMTKALNEFDLAHNILVKAPENNDRINSELILVQQQSVFLQAAISSSQASSSKLRMNDVFLTSERILQVMDNVTNLYARIT
jgi:Type IV pili methyl-accepting chemotaxis transducer N-term